MTARALHPLAPAHVRIIAGFVLALAGNLLHAAGVPITSGHAGHWYAADRRGEGWVLELRGAGSAWLYWFTYDEEGGQRWMTATGQVIADGDDGQRIDFPQLVVTRGARFGAAFDPDDVERFLWGELSFDLSCAAGGANYESVLASFGAGSFQLTRLTSLHEIACPWQRPTLTALYDIESLESPHLEDSATAALQMNAMSDEGRLFGLDGQTRTMYSWPPGDSALTAQSDPLPGGADSDNA